MVSAATAAALITAKTVMETDKTLLTNNVKRLADQQAFFGAGNGTRTRGLLITNELLYRLSYTSILSAKEL